MVDFGSVNIFKVVFPLMKIKINIVLLTSSIGRIPITVVVISKVSNKKYYFGKHVKRSTFSNLKGCVGSVKFRKVHRKLVGSTTIQ